MHLVAVMTMQRCLSSSDKTCARLNKLELALDYAELYEFLIQVSSLVANSAACCLLHN